MSGDGSHTAPRDPSRIDLENHDEVAYWMRELGVSEERLRQLVKDHGSSAEAVRSANG